MKDSFFEIDESGKPTLTLDQLVAKIEKEQEQDAELNKAKTRLSFSIQKLIKLMPLKK